MHAAQAKIHVIGKLNYRVDAVGVKFRFKASVFASVLSRGLGEESLLSNIRYPVWINCGKFF